MVVFVLPKETSMRIGCGLLIACLLTIPSVVLAEDDAGPAEPAAPRSSLEIVIDKSKVDLIAHRLEVRMNHVAAKVTVKVFGEFGAVLAETEQDFTGRAPGTSLLIGWSPSSDENVSKIEVFAYDKDGFYKGIAILPWSVSIPHEEVNFKHDSAEIEEAEKPKLDASFAKVSEAILAHKELGKITLFIAGHTDTVGSAVYNVQLSRARAQAIGSWFRRRGLKVPIAFEGFGESAPLVKTADEVDEPKNRRVDYILSVDEPLLKSGTFRPAWKRIN
jgi:outer membrane protein OmpA-like peptidoglycan-associated protein